MTLEKNYHAEQREKALVRPADAEMKTLILRYLQAWETDDVDGLVALLKEDARLSMPPLPSWYWGREAIHAYLLTVIFPSGVQKQWCVYPTRTNGQHAFSVYRAKEANGSYRALGIALVTFDDLRLPKQIAEVAAFLDPSLVTCFGFPLHLLE